MTTAHSTDLTCRLCGAPGAARMFGSGDFSLHRCAACAFVQVVPLPDQAAIETIYDRDYFTRGKYFDTIDDAQLKEQRRRLRYVKKCGVKPGARILELGCATGDFLELAKRDYEMWGVELSADALDIARRNNPDLADRLLCTSIEKLPASWPQFDAVLLWDVIEHLRDPRLALENLVSHLAPEGRIIVSTPNVDSMSARLLKARWAFMTPPEHLSFFGRRSLRAVFAELGGAECFWTSRGKWVNVQFLAYKIQRTFPEYLPDRALGWMRNKLWSKWSVYVPTGDIQYMGAVFRRAAAE